MVVDTLKTSTIAETTRDLIAPISNYSLYLCHEASGDVITDSAPASQRLFGDITLGSSPASFDSTSYIPDGAQNQKIVGAGPGVAYDMSNGVGQLIVAFDIFADAAPSGNEDYCAFSRAANNEGQFKVGFLSSGTAGRCTVGHISSADGSTTVTRNSDAHGNCYDGSWHNIVAYLDASNMTIGLYVDGATQGIVSIAAAEDLLVGSATTDSGFQPFCRANGPTSYAPTELGVASANTATNRLMVMRTSSDQSGNIATIAADLTEIGHELVWSLDGI